MRVTGANLHQLALDMRDLGSTYPTLDSGLDFLADKVDVIYTQQVAPRVKIQSKLINEFEALAITINSTMVRLINTNFHAIILVVVSLQFKHYHFLDLSIKYLFAFQLNVTRTMASLQLMQNEINITGAIIFKTVLV